MCRENKKSGFTLVELIAVIMIIAILLIILVPNITKVSTSSKQSLRDSKVRTIVAAGEEYGHDIINDMQGCTVEMGASDLATKCTISLDELVNLGYMEPENKRNEIVDPITNGKMSGTVLLCYNPDEVTIYGNYYEVGDDRYSCADIDMEAHTSLNLSSIGGVAYIGGTSVSANIITSGTFSGGFSCTGSSPYATCKIEDGKAVFTPAGKDKQFTDADYKEAVFTIHAGTLSKDYTLRVYPTKLKILVPPEEAGNTCMSEDTSLTYELDALNAGTLSVETTDNEILEGIAKNGKLSLVSNNKFGRAEITIKEDHGRNVASIVKDVYRLSLAGDVPENMVLGERKNVTLDYGGTGALTITSSDPNVIRFSTVSRADADTLTLAGDDREFTIVAVGMGSSKVTIKGATCGEMSFEIEIASMELEETSGVMYLGGEQKGIKIYSDADEVYDCYSSNDSAVSCSMQGNDVFVLTPERVAQENVIITVSNSHGGTATYTVDVLETSMEVFNNSGEKVTSICSNVEDTSAEVLFARGENMGETIIDSAEPWELADVVMDKTGEARNITIQKRDLDGSRVSAPYKGGYNTGTQNILLREKNGNRTVALQYNTYSLTFTKNSANLKVDETVEFDVDASGTGEVTISSSNDEVARAELIVGTPYNDSINGENKRTVKVTAEGVGTAVITVRGSKCGAKTFTVNVEGKDLYINLENGTYTNSLGSNRITCKTTGIFRTCKATLPSIYPKTGFEAKGYSKTKDDTNATYRAGSEITINALNNGSTLYGNSVDSTRPVCSMSVDDANLVIGEEANVRLSCSDAGSGISSTTALGKSNFTVSDTSIGEISSDPSLVSSAGGLYIYDVGVTVKNYGFFNISLNEGSVKDNFGNGNSKTTSDTFFATEYRYTKAWQIGKVNPTDVLAILYDNSEMGGTSGTYSLVVLGNGDMIDFTEGLPWYDERSSITSVEIKEGVTNVGDLMMNGASSLENLTIPNGVTYIGAGAFSNADLKEVVIPSSVLEIREEAFYANRNLDSLSLSNGLKTIGNAAFSYNNLSSVSIPYSVESIGDYAFINDQDRQALTSLSLGGSLKTIGEGAFAYHLLTTLNIPNKVTSIGNAAFVQLDTTTHSTLTSLTFSSPSSLKTVGDEAFLYARLGSLSIPSSVTSIGARAFGALREGVETLDISANVTSLGENFAYGKALKNFVVASGNPRYVSQNGIIYTKDMKTLVKCPDDYYKDNTVLDVPSSVTVLARGAFEGWQDYGTNIQGFALNLPSGITNMNIDANFIFFTIGSINISGNSNFTSVDGVLYSSDMKKAYRLPPAYDASSYTIKSGVVSIEDYFGYGNSRVKTIDVPGSVTTIGDYALMSDADYGFKTINLNMDDATFSTTSLGLMVYPEGGVLSHQSRTINVMNSAMKTKIDDMYSGAEYTINVVVK